MLPAAYVVFDLLGHDGVDRRDESYQQWRGALERLFEWLPPGLVLTPVPRFRPYSRWTTGPRWPGIVFVERSNFGLRADLLAPASGVRPG